jgi:dTDP-glucose 4,6-dehydratase
MRIMLTGASGFVGSHVLRHILATTDWDVVCPLTFRHKGLPARMHSALDGHDFSRVETVMLDLRGPVDSVTMHAMGNVDVIMNVASQSHVDRSIAAPDTFITDNIRIMNTVLDMARHLRPWMLLQMSTDEVYGPAAGDYRHKEWDPVLPSNPYSASKAAQEAACISYWRTYGVPVVLTNTMNIIGEMQDPEKFLPMIIRNLRDGQPITVHTAPDGTPGSRFYLHARNLADAWVWLVNWYEGVNNVPSYAFGETRPERFHIVGEREVDNIALVRTVGGLMGYPEDYVDSLIKPVSFHESRPGHDLRYALDGSRLAARGWRAPVGLEESLERTVRWTLQHPQWLDL